MNDENLIDEDTNSDSVDKFAGFETADVED